MMDNMLNSLFTEALANVNVVVIVALMAVGFIIKHFKFLEKVENKLIPPILIVLAFVFEFFEEGFSIVSVFTAIVSGAIAIGFHQEGKNVFSLLIPKLTSIFKGEVESEGVDDVEEDIAMMEELIDEVETEEEIDETLEEPEDEIVDEEIE